MRAAVHHVVELDADQWLVFGFGSIYRVDVNARRAYQVAELVGSRPLRILETSESVYYGEYRSNPERSPVHIWTARNGGARWEAVWTFTNVRHVHGVFRDAYSGDLWITTGDEDHESALWVTKDEFGSVDRVFGGNQQSRVVQLLFTEEHVYFGSDAPGEPNYICRYHRAGGDAERLQPVGGPVFYGCRVGNSLFFSTVCEPGAKVPRTAQLWRSDDGVSWRVFAEFPKDIWPMKLFQYGQVLLPEYVGNEHHALWFTPFATSGDQLSLQVKL
jgi:hypothetical protein